MGDASPQFTRRPLDDGTHGYGFSNSLAGCSAK